MNGRRLDGKTYISAYQLVKYRDGEKCAICGGHIGDPLPSRLVKKWKLSTNIIEKLEIDHTDGNPLNNPPDGSNWRLLCQADNLEAWVRSGGVVSVRESVRDIVPEQKLSDAKKGKVKRVEEKAEADREAVEKERKELSPVTSIVKEHVSYRDGESSMQANAFLQAAWGRWLAHQLEERGFIPRKEAINGGAYVTGGNPVTIARYLNPAISPQGPLEEFKDENTGEVLIRYKEKFRKLLSGKE